MDNEPKIRLEWVPEAYKAEGAVNAPPVKTKGTAAGFVKKPVNRKKR
jgi:hypothetical protein